jgi:hypothetical protein
MHYKGRPNREMIKIDGAFQILYTVYWVASKSVPIPNREGRNRILTPSEGESRNLNHAPHHQPRPVTSGAMKPE